MEKATGELNMTVITVVAIAAIAGLFYAFVWPMIQRAIVDNTCSTFGTNYQAVKNADKWYCCPGSTYSASCKATD